MALTSDPISVRTTRLNNLILGNNCSGKLNNRCAGSGASDEQSTSTVGHLGLPEAICRESLLDAFYLLYNECDKDVLKKRDKNIAEFVNKCKFLKFSKNFFVFVK